MKKTMLRLITSAALTLAATGIAPAPVGAAGPASLLAPEATFDSVGVIEDFDASQGALVINDKAYQVTASTEVYAGDKRVDSGALRRGMHVGFKARYQDNRRTITEIRLLSGRKD